MIITKEYLSHVIKQEANFVLCERKLLLVESQIANLESTEFFALLREQVGEISSEEVELLKEFLGGFMKKAKQFLTNSLTAGVNGIKRLIELLLGTIREVFLITSAAGGATAVLGSILTQTAWGQSLIKDVLGQLTNLLGTGGQVGEFAIRTVNQIVSALQSAGVPVPGVELMDPTSVAAFFTKVMSGAKTVVTTLINLDPTILAAIAVGAIAAAFVSWLLAGGFKKLGLKLKGRGLLGTLKNLMFKKKEKV